MTTTVTTTTETATTGTTTETTPVMTTPIGTATETTPIGTAEGATLTTTTGAPGGGPAARPFTPAPGYRQAAESAGAAEFRGLQADAEALVGRIGGFRDDHPDGCGCDLCGFMADGYGDGWRDELVLAQAAARVLAQAEAPRLPPTLEEVEAVTASLRGDEDSAESGRRSAVLKAHKWWAETAAVAESLYQSATALAAAVADPGHELYGVFREGDVRRVASSLSDLTADVASAVPAPVAVLADPLGDEE